jgi:hypothetical protein
VRGVIDAVGRSEDKEEGVVTGRITVQWCDSNSKTEVVEQKYAGLQKIIKKRLQNENDTLLKIER